MDFDEEILEIYRCHAECMEEALIMRCWLFEFIAKEASFSDKDSVQ